MLKNIAIFTSFLCLAACGEETLQSDGDSVADRMQSFEAARVELGAHTNAHVDHVMAGGNLAVVVREELAWSAAAGTSVADMERWIRSVEHCTNDEGNTLNTSDALSALRDLRIELHAHQVGMITMIDLATATASEMNFQSRQTPLVEELQAHFEALVADADAYSCAF